MSDRRRVVIYFDLSLPEERAAFSLLAPYLRRKKAGDIVKAALRDMIESRGAEAGAAARLSVPSASLVAAPAAGAPIEAAEAPSKTAEARGGASPPPETPPVRREESAPTPPAESAVPAGETHPGTGSVLELLERFEADIASARPTDAPPPEAVSAPPVRAAGKPRPRLGKLM